MQDLKGKISVLTVWAYARIVYMKDTFVFQASSFQKKDTVIWD